MSSEETETTANRNEAKVHQKLKTKQDFAQQSTKDSELALKKISDIINILSIIL